MPTPAPSPRRAHTPVPHYPAPGRHLARVEEDILILDVPADRYEALSGAADWMRLVDGAVHIADAALAEELKTLGVIVETAGAPSAVRPLPATEALDISPTAPVSAALRAGASLVHAALRFRGRSLEYLLATPLPGRRRFGAFDPVRAAHLLAAAQTALPYLPHEGECLKRAFQLRHLLAVQGMRTDWVFGVRTWPFAAHCWLQSGNLVVGDRLERVLRYTPILRI